jgi:hypothetical protein
MSVHVRSPARGSSETDESADTPERIPDVLVELADVEAPRALELLEACASEEASTADEDFTTAEEELASSVDVPDSHELGGSAVLLAIKDEGAALEELGTSALLDISRLLDTSLLPGEEEEEAPVDVDVVVAAPDDETSWREVLVARAEVERPDVDTADTSEVDSALEDSREGPLDDDEDTGSSTGSAHTPAAVSHTSVARQSSSPTHARWG